MGSENSLSGERARGIEQCDCPAGYTGLSCQQCAFGYVPLYHNNRSNNMQNGPFDCVKCNCNGHAATCDPLAGTCGACLHNTFGSNCQQCAPGFYGDATTGTTDACTRCRCPLEPASNNFSPTCAQSNSSSSASDAYAYVCDQCPAGYEGDQCQR